jgi:hypothetical protein
MFVQTLITKILVKSLRTVTTTNNVRRWSVRHLPTVAQVFALMKSARSVAMKMTHAQTQKRVHLLENAGQLSAQSQRPAHGQTKNAILIQLSASLFLAKHKTTALLRCAVNRLMSAPSANSKTMNHMKMIVQSLPKVLFMRAIKQMELAQLFRLIVASQAVVLLQLSFALF